MAGNFLRVLIFVVDMPVMKIFIHENYSNIYVIEHSQAGGMAKNIVEAKLLTCSFLCNEMSPHCSYCTADGALDSIDPLATLFL